MRTLKGTAMTKRTTILCIASAYEFLILFLCCLLVLPPQLALAADPVPDGSTGTTVSSAGNGVPVVNIATPSGSGLSHNSFTSYDVDAQGLVLNNGDMSEQYRQSQLAGQVAANPNLAAGNQASVILNEVTGGGRTNLAGFTEVLGGKADVIIANPFGISSSGGGFLNTDQVSLVTGSSDISGGTLNGFNVRGGDILITGTGLDASAQQVLNLVSRKLVVEGQVNAQTLNMVAGTNHWDPATGATTAIASDGTAAPSLAIDTSALGGMYTGRINMKVTEAGAGVRIQGEAAATSDDFVITASGKVEITSKLSAQRDLSITSASGGADAVKAVDANLSAGRNIAITATTGGATLTGGGIKAVGELAYNVGTLTDTASATAGITDANKRYGDTVNITGTGAVTLDGVYYGAGSALNLSGGSISAGTASQASLNSGGTMSLTATGGDLALANAALKSAGNMNLTSNTGNVSFGSASGTGVQATTGNINIIAAADLTNAAVITADSGDVVARLDGTLTNSGSIHASNLLDVGGKTSVEGYAMYNTGALYGGALYIRVGTLSVTGGGMMESTGNMDVAVSNTLTIGGSGDTTSRILAATSGTGTGTLAATNAFTNYGVLHSGYDLNVSGGSFSNMATGGVSALNDLTARATNGDFLNQGALYAGNDLVASASGQFLNDSTLAAAMGTIGSGRDMTFTAAEFINSSYIDAGRNLTITAPIFKNEVKGGDTRVWGAIGAWEEDMLPSPGSYICSNGWDTCSDQYMEASAYQYQNYSGGTPQFTPHIYGGGTGTVLIQGFDQGYNTGSSISGDTVTFTGNTGSTFTNTDLSLSYIKYTYQFTYHTETWYAGTNPNPTTITNVSAIVATTYPISGSTRPATIRANTLNMGGFALTNSGSPIAASPSVRTASATAFPGLTLTLPTNPNGMFVTSQDSSASYLVETNPLYTNVDNYLGSEYLIEKYNFDADEVIKRLGDAGYETYLVGQQLASLTGNKLLSGYADEKAQMQGLMDNALSQADELGLTFGQPLSAEAQAALTSDMIWMVETEVNGEKVLAPVVYLASSTKSMLASTDGASISGQNVNMDLTSLTNTGSTISGNTLNVTTEGDIKNISGTISGGTVNLTSTSGSIINQTQAVTTGDAALSQTQIGKEAGIVASGDLNLTADKDITNLGAKIAAGGDASLTAGNNVTLDTIQDTSSLERKTDLSSLAISTTKQIGSTVSSGGNLNISAKNDITVAGSTVSSGGDANLEAGNDVNVVTRNDSQQVVTSSTIQGFGVSGGLWGKETTNSDHLQTTAKGSTISSGGDTNLSADETVLLEGAKVNSKGDVNIAATDVKVLEARNVDRTTTHTEKTSILSISGGEDSTSSASSSASSSAEDGTASAGASADASYSKDVGGLDFVKTTTTDTSDETTKAVASQINAGKGLNITAKKDVTLRGAEVTAGGDANISGENVNVLAAQDTHVSTSTTNTSKVGLYVTTDNSASADAGADATEKASKTGASVSAGATADATATSENTIDFVRNENTSKATVDITNTGTTLSSGGTLNINSGKNLVVQGSDLSGEQGVNLKAQDMSFVAADDVHLSSTTTTKSSTGLYVDGNADASASADADAKAGTSIGAGGAASASAEAKASIGIKNQTSTSSETEGSTTAKVSSIKSGSGSITRTADNSITDVGTNIEAAGDFSQTAATYENKAAADTSFKTTSSSDETVKVGVYAKAEAGASVDADASAGLSLSQGLKKEADANAKVSANVGVGIQMSYDKDSSESSSSSSTAVVSNIKAGGAVTSVTSGKTSLEGTNISGGDGVTLEADSLDYTAAKNTEASSSHTNTTNAAASLGVTKGTGKGVELEASGGTSDTTTSASSSTALAGSIESGNGITIKTKGDTRLEGTNLAAEGDTTIDAGGKVTMDAARDTSTSSEKSYNVSAGLSLGESSSSSGSKGSVSVNAAGGFSNADSSSSTATAGSVATGGKLTITSGKTVSLEGTKMEAGGDATVSGKEGVEFTAAKSTSESTSYGVQAGASVGKSQTGNAKETSTTTTLGGNLAADYSHSKESVAEAGSLASGGNLLIESGKDVKLEGTDLAAGNKAAINAGGSVEFTEAESTSQSVDLGLSASGSVSKTTKTPNTTPAASATQPKNTGTGGTQGSDGSAQSDKDLAAWQQKQSSVVDELKAKQQAAAAKTAATTATSDKTATTAAASSKTATTSAATTKAATTAASAAGAAKSAISGAVGTGNAAGATTSAATTGATTPVKKKTVTVSGQAQFENDSTKKGVSISSGAGGVEINAAGGSVQSQGASIQTDGTAAITSGGKTSLVNTDVQASQEQINAAGGVERKTVPDAQ